jgi:hypothetical protein
LQTILLASEHEIAALRKEVEKLNVDKVDVSALNLWEKFGMWLLSKSKKLPIRDSYKVAPAYAKLFALIVSLPVGVLLARLGVSLDTVLLTVGAVFGLSANQLEQRIVSTMKALNKSIEDGELTIEEITNAVGTSE